MQNIKNCNCMFVIPIYNPNQPYSDTHNDRANYVQPFNTLYA